MVLARAPRIEVQVKSEFGKGLECEGEEHTIFFYPGVIPHDRANRGHPVRQVPIDSVTLLLENPSACFILLLKPNAPVVIQAIIAANDVKAAVLKKRIVMQIAVANAHLQICHRLHR